MRSTPIDDPAPRAAGVAMTVLLHVAVFAALLQIEAVRKPLVQARPLFVSYIMPVQPKVADRIPPPPKIAPTKQRPRLITVDKPVTAANTLIAPPPPPQGQLDVTSLEAPPTPSVPVAPLSTAIAPSPRVINGVEYIRPPQVEYPAVSRRLNEQGRVLLRVLINRDGHADRVEVQTSSGSRRLDEAAIKAAREALYRPYSENGQAIPVWALVPTLFELS